MSQSNVEKVRASLATWDGVMLRPEERPFERVMSLDETIAFFDPEAVYEDAVLPDHAGEAYRGPYAWARAAEVWLEPCEWLIVELERTIDADDRVLSLHRARMKMRLTGLEFEMPVAYLFTFQEGKVVHARAFADHAEALKAVGLI
jgi:ketosteroid isomerase-like protein